MVEACSIDDKFLFTHSLFGGLTTEELAYIKQYLHEELYEPDEFILRQGESNNRIFFIISGEVHIVKHTDIADEENRLISTLHIGDTFGEMELIDIQPCAASAIASQATKVLTFTNYDLYQLSKTHLKTFSMIIMNLAREISRRLRKTDKDFANLLYQKDKSENG